MDEPLAKHVKVEENVFSDIKDTKTKTKINEKDKDEEEINLFDKIVKDIMDVKVIPIVSYINNPEYIELLNTFKKKKNIIKTKFNEWYICQEIYVRYFKYINNKLFELDELQMIDQPTDLYFQIIMEEDEYKHKFSHINIRLIKLDNILKCLKVIKQQFNIELLQNSIKYPSLYFIIEIID